MTKTQIKEEKSLVKKRSLGGATLAKWLFGGIVVIGVILLVLLAVYSI